MSSEKIDKDRVFSSWFLSGGPPSFSKRSTTIEKKNHIRAVIGENTAGATESQESRDATSSSPTTSTMTKDRTKRKLPFTDDDEGVNKNESSTSKPKTASSARLDSKQDGKPALLLEDSMTDAASTLTTTSAMTSPSFSNKPSSESQEEISSAATEAALVNIIAKESEKRKSLDKLILDSL